MASRSKVVLGTLIAFSCYLSFNQEIKAQDIGKKESQSKSNKDIRQDIGQTKVNTKSDNIDYSKNMKKATLTGNVEITLIEKNSDDEKLNGMTIITGNKIMIDTDQRIVFSEDTFNIVRISKSKDGNNKIIEDKTEIKGKSFEFHIPTKRIVTKYSTLKKPAPAKGHFIYINGEEMTIYDQGKRISVKNGEFNTCDHYEKNEPTHYSIKAAIIDFKNNDSLFAWNTSLNIRDNQIYWAPFLYLPLKSPDKLSFSLDAGQNQVEGYFMNYKTYYKLNDYHDGNIFLRLMQNKWLGLGFEHTWLALPNSISRAFAYGNVLNNRYFEEADETKRSQIQPLLEDHEVYLKHKQWLPFLPRVETEFGYHKKNFYNLNNLFGARDNFTKYNVNIKDTGEYFEPIPGLEIKVTPNINAKYDQIETTNIDQITQAIKKDSQNDALNLNSKINLDINKFNINIDNTYSNIIVRKPFVNQSTTTNLNNTSQVPESDVSLEQDDTDISEQVNFFKNSDQLSLTSNINLNYSLTESLKFSGTFNYQNRDNRIFRQNTNFDLPAIETIGGNKEENLTSNLSLTQSLGFGKLALKMNSINDFLDDQIFIKDSEGNIIPDNQLSEEQIQERQEAITKRRNGRNLNSVPELELTLNPFFAEVLPVNVSSSIGSYYLASNFPDSNLDRVNISNYLNITRSEIAIKLGSKELDFGFGNKLNFAETGYTQRFYQTQDAQYILKGRVNYKNDFSEYFIPNISYEKGIDDNRNNSPFGTVDSLSVSKQDTIRGDLRLVNQDFLKLNIGNLGYDYQSKRYLSPVSLSANSDFTAGLKFSLSAQTGYRLKNVDRNNDLNRVNSNFIDKDKLDSDSHFLKEDAFQKKYSGYSISEAQKDIKSNLSEDQLKQKYGIDKRLYDVNDKLIGDSFLTESDIGTFQTEGGAFNNMNFGLTVSTPWEFGSSDYFGEESDIPWGVASRIKTNIDVSNNTLYQTEDNNGNAIDLTDQQEFDNLLNRFQNSTLELFLVLGGSWQTHTQIQMSLGLLPPEKIEEGKTSTQTNRPFIPFNTSLSIIKDLHDLILSLSWTQQYLPNSNVNNWGVNFNLQLTAFPDLLSGLSDGLKSGQSSLSNITNQINN